MKRHQTHVGFLWLLASALLVCGASVAWADNEWPYAQTLQAGLVNQAAVPFDTNLLANNNLCKTPTSSDPIDLSTGEFLYDRADLMLPGLLEPLSISFRYHSQRLYNSHWGFGWFFPWEQRLFVLSDGNVQWRLGSGEKQIFTNAGSGNFTAPQGHFVTLVQSGGYVLTTKNKLRYEFSAEGVLEKFKDRAGNEIDFDYEMSGGSKVKSPIAGPSGTTVAMDYRLVRITGTLGNYVDFEYYGAGDGPKNGRLKRLVDSYNRIVNYDYGDAGNLISVTSPATVYQDETGAIVNQGRTTSFAYSSGFGSTRLGAPEDARNHNLLTVTDDKGQIFLTNEYTDDRVTKQFFNDGELNVSYTLDSQGKVTRADETDGEGVLRKYHFTDNSNNLTKLEIFQKPGVTHAGLSYPLTTEYSYGTCCNQVEEIKFPRGYPSQPNGIEFLYDAATGNLLEERRKTNVLAANGPDDIVTEYNYDFSPCVNEFNVPKTMTDPEGRVTTYFYDFQEGTSCLNTDLNGDGLFGASAQNAGNIVKIVFPNATLPDGTTQGPIEAKFRYNSYGQRTHVIQPEGNIVEYQYFPPGPLGSHFGLLRKVIVDPGGLALTTEYTYDALDHLDTVKDPNGTNFGYTVNELGETVQIDAPLDVSTRMTYDGNGNLAKREVANYDENGVVGTPAWIVTSYQYDDWDRLVSMTEDVSSGVTRTTSYEYDLAGNLKQVTSPEGNKTRMAYDERNQMWERRSGYQSADEVVEEFHPDANGNTTTRKNGLGKIWTTSFDLLDRPTEVIDPVGNRFRTAYNKKSEPTQRQTLNAAQFPQTQTDFVWDELGRRTKAIQTDPFALLAPSENRFFFDKNGRLDKTRTPKGHVTDYGYDAADRLTMVVDPLGNKREITLYDNNGNLKTLKETEQIPTPAIEEYVTEYQYDPLNRLIEEKRTDTQTPSHQPLTSYFYDSRHNLKRVTDAIGKQTLFAYDLASRRTGMTQDATGILALTQYAFDKDDRLTQITDGDGFPTVYLYDVLDRLKTIDYAAGPDEGFTYDAAHNLKTHTAQDGVVTTLNYYDHNLLADRSAGTLREEFVWNALYLPTSAVKKVSAVPTSTVGMSYDGFGRLNDEVQDGATVHHGYDADHNLNLLNYPSGLSLTMTHDGLERLSSVIEGSNNWTYTYAGPFRVHQRVTNLTKSYGYDGLRRLTSLQTNGGLVSFGYSYDDLDRRLWEQRNHAPFLGSGDGYGYEGNLWLKEVWYNGAIPPSGGSNFQINLTDGESRLSTTLNGTPTAYNSVDFLHRYTSIGGTSRVYDLKGNLTDDGTHLFEYDVWNRLTKVKDKATTNTLATYEHDAMGRRTKRIAGSVTSKYGYSGPRLLEEQEDTGSGFNLKVRYVYGAGLDEFLALDAGGSRYFAYQDGLGSTAAITTTGGSLQERYAYDAFGAPTVTDSGGTPIVGANGLPTSSISNQLWYTGARFDQESAYYHMRARQYEPKAGQFVSRDPLGYVNGPNPYTYVNADPINFIDPFGLKKKPTTDAEREAFLQQRNKIRELVSLRAQLQDFQSSWSYKLNPLAIGDAVEIKGKIKKLEGQYDQWKSNFFAASQKANQQILSTMIGALEFGGTAGVTSAPGVGMGMDIAVVGDPQSSNLDVGVALLSIGLSALTLDFGPDLGPLFRQLRKGDEVVDAAKRVSRECPDIEALLRPGGKLLGEAGTSRPIRLLKGDAAEAESLFSQLAKGGVDVTPPGHPGKVIQLPSGYVGFRPFSTSGPLTIDVNIPGISIKEIKFVP